MTNTLRRRIVAVLATPLLLGSVTAAAPSPAAAPAASTANPQVVYKETFYSDATYTQAVGEGYGDCDGNLVYMDWGYQTRYSITLHFYPCAR